MTLDFQLKIMGYFAESQKIYASIAPGEVARLAHAIEEIRISDSTVYVAGNGGSASTASHFATDIGVGSLRRANPVKVVSLCDNAAVMTALANDITYDSVFEQQIKLLGRAGDLLVLISASGNSQNLVSAAEAARALNMRVFTLTGFDGGILKTLTPESNVHVPSRVGSYGLVEDAHLAICHVITECVRS